MLWLALAFTAGMTWLFAREVWHALASGNLRGLGWSMPKANAPVRYWLGVGGYALNTIVAGAFSLLMALLGLGVVR